MVPSDERFDPREMHMVHAMLRREFALAPAAIRTVAAGSGDRAGVGCPPSECDHDGP